MTFDNGDTVEVDFSDLADAITGLCSDARPLGDCVGMVVDLTTGEPARST